MCGTNFLVGGDTLKKAEVIVGKESVVAKLDAPGGFDAPMTKDHLEALLQGMWTSKERYEK